MAASTLRSFDGARDLPSFLPRAAGTKTRNSACGFIKIDIIRADHLVIPLGRAVELQVLARNPAVFRKGRLPKVVREEMITLTAHQGQRFLDFIGHSLVYWPVLIALATGMRRGEILARRSKSVDRYLRVVQSLEQTKAGLRFKSPKNNKHRTITLPAFAVEELRTPQAATGRGAPATGHPPDRVHSGLRPTASRSHPSPCPRSSCAW